MGHIWTDKVMNRNSYAIKKSLIQYWKLPLKYTSGASQYHHVLPQAFKLVHKTNGSMLSSFSIDICSESVLTVRY